MGSSIQKFQSFPDDSSVQPRLETIDRQGTHHVGGADQALGLAPSCVCLIVLLSIKIFQIKGDPRFTDKEVDILKAK